MTVRGLKITRDLTELDKLEKYLKEHGYKYDRTDDDGMEIAGLHGLMHCIDQHQIVVYKGEIRDWDVICQYGSYGCEKGLLEAMGERVVREGGDSVEGYLTADEIIERLEARE